MSKKSETGERLRAVRCDLPEAEHKELRVEAARADTQMSKLVRRIIAEWLAARRGKR